MKTSIRKQIIRTAALALICVLFAAAACACARINDPAQIEKAKIDRIAGTWQLEDNEDLTLTFGRDGSFNNGKEPDDGYSAKYAFEQMLILKYENNGYPDTLLTIVEIEGNTMKLSYGPDEEIVLNRIGGKSKKAGGIVGQWTGAVASATYSFSEDGKMELEAGGEIIQKGTYEIKEILSMLFYNEEGELIDRDAVFYKIEGNKLTFYEIDSDGKLNTEDFWVFKRVK